MKNSFDFVQPADVADALDALSHTGECHALAGGTNVLVNMKRAPIEADLMVDLSRLDELCAISVSNGGVHLGAGTTFAQLLDWRPGGAIEALMHPMCEAFAGPLIRNRATIGGNICDASPAADASPVLLVLDANVDLQSRRSSRQMRLTDFFLGARQTALAPGEMLTGIRFRIPHESTRSFYYKLGKRKADAISIVSVAMTMGFDGDAVSHARIGLGAVAPVAMRAHQAEAALLGNALSPQQILTAATAAAEEAKPIDDFRAGADYRRNMVAALVKRGLSEIASSRSS